MLLRYIVLSIYVSFRGVALWASFCVNNIGEMEKGGTVGLVFIEEGGNGRTYHTWNIDVGNNYNS